MGAGDMPLLVANVMDRAVIHRWLRFPEMFYTFHSSSGSDKSVDGCLKNRSQTGGCPWEGCATRGQIGRVSQSAAAGGKQRQATFPLHDYMRVTCGSLPIF